MRSVALGSNPKPKMELQCVPTNNQMTRALMCDPYVEMIRSLIKVLYDFVRHYDSLTENLYEI